MATYLPASKYVWNQWIQTPPIYSIDPGTGSGITITANNTWTTTVAATTTTSVYSMNAVWNNWVTSNNYTPTLTWQDDAWNAWVEDEGYQRTLARRLDRQQAEREQRSREQLAAEQQQAENRIVAHARALDLLDVLLTDEERAGRAARQRIEIVGSDGQLYWIETHRQSVHGNIVRTDEHGCMLGRACVAPGMRSERGALPTADGWIGQYLGLKLDAVNFLSHANWSGIGRCRVPAAAAAPEAA